MGNKVVLGRKKDLVDDKYTRPQGLYQHRDIDRKKLRKLILDSKLAPCYPGYEDCAAPDLEECPICFLYYPSLNRSRCCTKGICTECFLQMKPPQSTRPTQCPFCKTSNYAVEYRGVRTKEEKGKEQIEEQKVIEAKIRMQQQELHEEEERWQKKQAMCSASQTMISGDVEYRDMPSNSVSVQTNELAPSNASHAFSASRQSPYSRHNREEEFDLDLEELMVMEAIWLSIQDRGGNGPVNTPVVSSVTAPSSSGELDNLRSMIPSEPSLSTGLVCAAAALAEHQHFSENLTTLSETSSLPCAVLPTSTGCLTTEGLVGHYSSENWADASNASLHLNESDWGMDARPLDCVSHLDEGGTSYSGSEGTDNVGTSSQVPGSLNTVGGHLVPETFEEQMMLAMAVSLAEAHCSRANTRATWM